MCACGRWDGCGDERTVPIEVRGRHGVRGVEDAWDTVVLELRQLRRVGPGHLPHPGREGRGGGGGKRGRAGPTQKKLSVIQRCYDATSTTKRATRQRATLRLRAAAE
jgi:hypothetical protein